MKASMIDLLQDPQSGEAVELFTFESGTDSCKEPSIIEGLVFSQQAGNAYPVINGVPVMIPDAFPKNFLAKHSVAIAELRGKYGFKIGSGAADDFSFSTQWESYFDDRVGRLWGWTREDRIQQFLMEMQVDDEWFKGKSIIDGGCGPAALSEGMAMLGADVVGFDYSSAVYEAERRRNLSNLEFVRGDLMSAGMKNESFDAALSIGVIMCTPDTYQSFAEICRMVKPGGRFYVWVYRRPETFLRRYIKHPLFDLARLIISRLPDPLQAMAVKGWASMIYGLHKFKHGEAKVPFGEYVVSAYDDMTPQWRRYHTAYELSDWFHKNGFASPILSHWDNPYGFGLVAVKNPQAATPGIHFGSAPKLWDEGQTLVG